MDKQIQLIKKIWKSGFAVLATVLFVASGLFLNLTGILAVTTPSLYVTQLGTNISEPPSADWSHSPSADNGDFVQFYSEVSTHVADPAENVTVKFELPTGFGTTGVSKAIATSSTTGVSQTVDNVNWDFRNNSCRIVFLNGTANASVDRNRDGIKESDGQIGDSIVSTGINFGTLTDGVIQISFRGQVQCTTAPASPTPTPSPTPGVTPSPSPSPLPSPSPSPSPSVAPSPTPGGLIVKSLATNISRAPSEDWGESVVAGNGEFVQFYGEVQTPSGQTFENVSAKFVLPENFATTQEVPLIMGATAPATNVSDVISATFAGQACKFFYVPGSTTGTLDKNRDGVPEVSGPMSDQIVTIGIYMGDWNAGIVQITFKTRVECTTPSPSPTGTPTPTPTPSPSPSVSPSPSPSPSPSVSPSPSPSVSPSPSPSPTPITVNVVVTVASPSPSPEVKGVTSLPETGLGVLGLAVMFSAAPAGIFLARFGRKHLTLSTLAHTLTKNKPKRLQNLKRFYR